MTKNDKTRARIARADTNLRYDRVVAYLEGVCITSRDTTHTTAFILPKKVHATITRPHGNRKTLSTTELRALDRALTQAGL